jgi:hypothetical protein
MPKPDADQFMGKRKLFLVPNYIFPPGMPEEAQQLEQRYWSEVRDHIQNLERSLGPVRHVFHEMLYEDGDEGMKLIEAMNPLGCSFVSTLCSSTATLQITEDRAIVEENMDWQRCLSVGLMSEKVIGLASEGAQETTQKRYDYIGTRIDETLKDSDNGILFIREDHRVQFPTDMQVFYVAPPGLDAIKRWINQQMQSYSAPPSQEAAEQPQETTDAEATSD